MPVKGAVIPYDDISKLLSLIPVSELVKTEMFLDGDHWQNMDGWVGWTPATGSETAKSDWDTIERGFTPKNVIKGMVWRLRGAVLGKEPDWEIIAADAEKGKTAPTNGSSSTAGESEWKTIDELMTLWWTKKGVHGVLKDFVTNYAAYGKASIQIYVPKGYVKADANGTMRLNLKNEKDLAEVLDRIYISAPGYKGVINAKDTDFGEEYVVLQLAQELSPGEIAANPNAANDTTFEVHYVDEAGQTHIRQVKATNEAVDISVDLGGNMLVYVTGMFERALISKPVKQQQKQLNHAKTMEGYALANINFPETTFINASLDTEKKKGPDGKLVETVKPLWRGAGTFTNLIGIITNRGDGGEQISTPDVKYKTPPDPEKFAKVAENNTRDMHQEAGMLYILLSSSPYPSGDARVESMTDYLILLVDYKTLVDTVGVWLLTTVLRLAFNFTGQIEKNDQFAVSFSTKLTIGQISDTDKAIMIQEVSAQLRSRRNYMVTAGVSDDPDLEIKAITADPPPIPPVTGSSASTATKTAHGNGKPATV